MSIRQTLHGSQLRGVRLSLEEKASLAQKHGYPALDFTLADARAHAGGDPGAVRALLESHGLQASTVGGVFGIRLAEATDEEFTTGLETVNANARAAAALGGTRTGTVLSCRADRPRDELWPVVVDRIRKVDEALEGTGVRLGMEFLGVRTLRLERAHPFVQSMAAANELLDAAGARNVGLTLDSYHWYAGGDSLDTIRHTPARRLVLLHVNDAKDLPRDQLDDQDRLVPGEGVIPLADWLRAIDSTGFDGFIALEVLGPRMADLSPDDCARTGKQSIDRILTAAGLS